MNLSLRMYCQTVCNFERKERFRKICALRDEELILYHRRVRSVVSFSVFQLCYLMFSQMSLQRWELIKQHLPVLLSTAPKFAVP